MAVLLSGGLLTGCSDTYPEPRNPDLLVPDETPAWVRADELSLFVGHPGVTVVDARPRKAWRAGHIPGAIHLNWLELRGRESGLLSADLHGAEEFIAERLGERGIGSSDWVVLVGDPLEGWGEEARIAWTLLWLGHRRVSILDGGIRAWKSMGEPTRRGILTREPTTYTAAPRPEVLASKGDVASMVERRGDWRAVLVDVRDGDEYRGSAEAPSYGASRRGHIPGAVHLPWRSLLDAEGRVLPPEQLKGILIPKGIRPDARIVTYCTGGVRSAHTWYVLHALGYPSVRNYASSWWEWSLDHQLPIERGGQRIRPEAPPWPPEEESGEPAE